MASLQDIVVSAAVNLGSALAFLNAFAILRLQPVNDRVYFPKWYLKGIRGSPSHSRGPVTKFVNLDWRMYIRFLNWALRMLEPELVEHAGLDSVAYIRIYLLGCLENFYDLIVAAYALHMQLAVIQVHTFSAENEFEDFCSNRSSGIYNFSACSGHIVMAYVFTFWTFYMLHKEYRNIMTMRLEFLANADRRPDQFSVLVRNVPPDPDESVSDYVEHSFRVNHHDHYLLHRVCI
ncbi:CSC1-like protein, partial [Drosera capensis]